MALYTSNAPHKNTHAPIKHNLQKRVDLLSKAFPGIKALASYNQYEQCITELNKLNRKLLCTVNKFRTHPSASVIIRKDKTKLELAQYLHAAWFSPVNLTWGKAIDNNHFSTWPGLTSRLFRQHIPLSTATA